jgi:predicted DCC family thiol-disulfide oxidoreductase YuxK
MRTLKEHVIVYDDQCPLCHLYTGAFVKTGMLDANGRQAYTYLRPEMARLLDEERSRNEIPLVDLRTGKVVYGIDSLFKVLGHRFPVLEPLFGLRPFRWLARTAYAFVSYNRKVVIPGRVFEAEGACTPTFHLPWRLAYLGVAWLVSAWVLTAYAARLVPLVPSSSFGREFLVCGGQIVFQAGLVGLLRRDRMVHYLGNLMTVSLAGSLLLLPALAPGAAGLSLPPLFYAAWFTGVVGLMFVEHTRRVKLLGIPAAATAGWVVYRLLVLAIIV